MANFVAKHDIDPSKGRHIHHRCASLAFGWLCQRTCEMGIPHKNPDLHKHHGEVHTFPNNKRMRELLEHFREELFYVGSLDCLNSDHYAAIYKQYSDALQLMDGT